MISAIGTVDLLALLAEYNRIEKNVVWYEAGSKKQAGLQYLAGEDPWLSATGRARKDISETEFNLLNLEFKDTMFEEMINKYHLLRARLMWVGPYSTYSMHRDTTPRIHVPLITNPDCYLVFQKGIVKHLSPGIVYWVDTREKHTFINCSEYPRLHLIGVVKS